MGVLATCIGSGPIGVLAVGILASQMGSATAVMIMSGSGIALMLCAVLYWPEMRKVRDI